MRIGTVLLILLVTLIVLGFLLSNAVRIRSETSEQEVATLVKQNTQLTKQVLSLERQLEQTRLENLALSEENDHLKSLFNNVDKQAFILRFD
jgi:peptidoglycan hydrolase CwlO-like protein